MIRLATFDALYTIVCPRKPFQVQYAEVFAPFFGQLSPDAVRSSFRIALKNLQASRPAYSEGPESWWADVIEQTALGAGAREAGVKEHMPTVVHQLLHRFSSREGYALYEDTIPTLKALHSMGVSTGLVTNADSRILRALDDLGALSLFDPICTSDDMGVEKPHKEIFITACSDAEVKPEETVHIGDELECDYHGASRAGLHALLLCRPSGSEHQTESIEVHENNGIRCIKDLDDVVKFVQEHNAV